MSELHRTPLTGLHEELSAKMTGFAGYSMPLQYKPGVMAEHLHTRNSAGLFDVSHMGQVLVKHPDGYDAAALALETLVPVDILGLGANRQRYGFFTNAEGGLLDDLMLSNRGDHLFVVVNAACKADDLALMQGNMPDCEVTLVQDRALIALQGPMAEAALSAFVPDCPAMTFLDSQIHQSDFGELWISRSGYSGEDGYEISIPADTAEAFARALLADERVLPIGLGARDSLRLEAGLCLYGQDIGPKTNPVAASLGWAIQKVRRRGGAREGGFPGADAVFDAFEHGTQTTRVGLRPDGRAPMRSGTQLFADEAAVEPVGEVTSGAFGPSLGAPMSMGYVQSALKADGTELFGEVRGKRLPVTVAKMPFVPANFKR